MRAIDVMVKDVVTVHPDTSVADAVKLLAQHDVSALPVVDATNRLIGVISEADLLRRTEIGTEKHRPWWVEAVTGASTLAHEFAKSHGQHVGEVMTTDVVTADEATPLSEIAALFERKRIKRVPIVKDGELIGIVSRSNLVQALATTLGKPATDSDTRRDREIRFEVLSRLKQQPWTDFGERNVIVSHGTVHVWGLVGTKDEHDALMALTEGVPGVAGVVDETIQAY